MGLFGRDPDRCNEDVRKVVHEEIKRRGEVDPAGTTRRNWSTQRDDDLYDPDTDVDPWWMRI